MSSRTDRDLLGDIQEALRRARSYAADLSYEQFLADTKTQDAVIHDYFGVNIDIVWQIVRDQLPVLTEQIAAALEDEPPG